MTLFISDINKVAIKTAIVYLIASVLVLAFSLVYSIFSHEVYSNYLSYAFLYPLIGGFCVYFGVHFTKFFSKWPYNFYNAGIATITVGSILAGINEIAGADTLYYLIFFYVGFAFVILSLVMIIYGLISKLRGK